MCFPGAHVRLWGGFGRLGCVGGWRRLRVGSGGEPSEGGGAEHGLGAAAGSETVVERADASLDGACADAQLVGDGLVCDACGEHAQQLQLAEGRRVGRRGAVGVGGPEWEGSFPELLE